MDPDVSHDPIFQDLLTKHELAGRKLRDAVAEMRAFFLKNTSSPSDETTTEKWRGAILSEEASDKFQRVEETAAQLLRYAYELAPKNSTPGHMEELELLRAAHMKRAKYGGGWSSGRRIIRGIEERVIIDDGPPVTIILKPSAWSYSARARRKKPAKSSQNTSSSEADKLTDDDDDVHRAPPGV